MFSVTFAAPPQASYVPHRVYNAGERRFSDFEAMLADLARADVVFVGEQHDDPATHRLELAVLEGLARRRASVVVAMEMFERDAQQAVDDYLAGRISEQEFLKLSRPWPNYAADYRPLVEFAKSKGWRVIAGNAPRRYASEVSKNGLQALDALPQAERGLVARDINCPQDDYFKRFAEAMRSHPGAAAHGNSGGDQGTAVERMYLAQCVKDETMAESVARASDAEPKPLVVHFNGAFHSDYALGAAARVKRRLPAASVRVVSIIPVADLDAIKVEDYARRGDYLVFTLKPRKGEGRKG
ncbi:MAG TPA: ChaN family lipoprotein [Blastocatellia bacterium]|nr:ChaN family lipoprotein [Blastocatellia bacterium]